MWIKTRLLARNSSYFEVETPTLSLKTNVQAGWADVNLDAPHSSQPLPFCQEINVRREFVAPHAAEDIADRTVVVEEEQILPGAAGEQIDREIVKDRGVDAVGGEEIVAVEAW